MLAKHIIRIVTDNRNYRLEELRQNLLKRNHPEKIINYFFTKSFQPKNSKEEKEIIAFTRTYNPNYNFNHNRFNNCLNNINNRELCETFSNKKVLLTTRQPKNLKKMLLAAKFDLHPELPNRKPNGLFSCTDSIYHKNGYIKTCKSSTFQLTNGKSVTWNHNKFFDCDSKDVLYILICNNCDYFYLGKTINFKQRICKHKSDVKHPENSTCSECADHLRDCAKIERFFQIHPFYHEKDHYLRDYKEKGFIIKWKPLLNISKTCFILNYYYFVFNDYLRDNKNNFIFL